MIFLIFALFGSLHFLIQTWTFFWCHFPFLLKSFLGISLGQFFWQRIFWLFTYRKLWFWILLLFCCCFGCIGSQLRHAGSLLHHEDFSLQCQGYLVMTCKLSCSVVHQDFSSQSGIEPMSLTLKGGFLTTGPPGKSLKLLLLLLFLHSLLCCC